MNDQCGVTTFYMIREELMVNFFKVVFLIAIAGLISACAISKSKKLAVDCQTDEALQVIDEAAKGGGLTAEIAKLEREAVLRDAGRIDEAESYRAQRESKPGMTEKENQDAQESILKTVEDIRKDREKRTGSPECQ
jgi:hypothetical protein